MQRELPRPFTGTDLTIAVAIAVVAIATAVYADHDFMSAEGGGRWFGVRRLRSDDQPTWAGPLRFQAARTQTDFVTFLGVTTGGLALALGRRVLTEERSYRGPGTVAVAVAACILCLRALEVALVGSLYGMSQYARYIHFFAFWVKLELDVSIAIVGAWTVLVLAGRWRTQIDWWDRLGRWLGWAWIGVLAYRTLSRAFWAWSNTITNYPWF